MGKFLNKKEQVIDLKLTSYGNYLFSIGKFKPMYYAFFDDNILYDGAYAQLSESQNAIQERIKNQTSYLESQVLFEDIENENTLIFTDGEITSAERIDLTAMGGELWTGGSVYFGADVTPTQQTPRLDNYKLNAVIGDAKLEGDTQNAPAWKIVTLNGRIVSSSAQDNKNSPSEKIPQINVHLNYIKKVRPVNYTEEMTNQDFRRTLGTTRAFSDENVIELLSDDAMIYVDEQNTQLLTENFDIEVFEVDFDAIPGTYDDGTGAVATDMLTRKYFKNDFERFNGGYIPDDYQFNIDSTVSSQFASSEYDTMGGFDLASTSYGDTIQYASSSVAYYFNIEADSQISEELACRGASVYNKKSYYIDLDFDCQAQDGSDIEYVDIYGVATEPEICQ